jgi:hypothetical protein
LLNPKAASRDYIQPGFRAHDRHRTREWNENHRLLIWYAFVF